MNYPVLEKGYSVRGADMGRSNIVVSADPPPKLRMYKMPMSSCGCYDSGGAYWGMGYPMWHAFDDKGNECFIRAQTRKLAKEEVQFTFPKATFYR